MLYRSALLAVLIIAVTFCAHTANAHNDKTPTIDNARPKIVCFGDSVTKRTYPDILAGLVNADAIKSAAAGHSTGQAMSRLGPQVLEQEPDVVVILLGTNDIRPVSGVRSLQG